MSVLAADRFDFVSAWYAVTGTFSGCRVWSHILFLIFMRRRSHVLSGQWMAWNSSAETLLVVWPALSLTLPWYVHEERFKRFKMCIARSQEISSHSYGTSTTCHMGSRRVTCHPTQVNASRLNPSQAGWYSIYLPQRDRRLSWPRWLGTYQNDLPDSRQSPIQVVTGLNVD